MSEKNIVGREHEVNILREILSSNEAEFFALYGRQRVGKTHLVREFFTNKGTYFEITGQKDGTLKEQLENFISAFSTKFHPGISLRPPTNWKEAFHLLNKEISKTDRTKKFILFLDELPWLASKRSSLMQILDHFWNGYWCKNPHLILIVCGSAASWMLDHLINAKGGLYNRLTKTMLLRPYNLSGAKAFLQSRGILLNNLQILNLYMVFGGIPHYLKQVSKGLSATQIINNVCFKKDGLLYGEFDRLFSSLFEHSEQHLALVQAIASQRNGISRNDLLKKLGISSGGGLNKRLAELETSDLIKSYVPLKNKIKNHYYRISDEYIYFYLQWIQPLKTRGVEGGESYWSVQSKTPKVLTWKGYVFETICLKHVDQIKKALEIDTIPCEVGGWRFLPSKGDKEPGAQIDLLFDREDGLITLCEIKYSEQEFVVDKDYAKQLANKIRVFEKHFPTKKQIFIAMISTFGIKHTIWSEELIQNEIDLNTLFGRAVQPLADGGP